MSPEAPLNPEQFRLLRDALIGSYGDFKEIRRLVRLKLNDRLTGIPKEIDLDAGVDKLLEWGENTGRIGELVAALLINQAISKAT